MAFRMARAFAMVASLSAAPTRSPLCFDHPPLKGRDRQAAFGVGHQAPIFSASRWLMGWRARAWSSSASRRETSNAAMQPMPAAVTAWR